MSAQTRSIDRRYLTPGGKAARPPSALAAVGLAIAVTLTAVPAAAVGQLGNVNIVTRSDGHVLRTYAKDGMNWIVGTPGQEYGIRVCNSTGGRVLAVMSVDGVNIVTGETASPSQAGYVLAAYECADINGWRKSQSATAAFYFTTLADAYATRTGRPDNLGVIGVAFFRERADRITWRDGPPKRIAASPGGPKEPVPRPDAAGDQPAERKERAQAESDGAAVGRSAPAPAAQIGTGHGRYESSYVQTTRFERENATPNETVAIHYDRRENLVAMGILPPPSMARTPNPFPSWPVWVPDPPQR